MPSRTSLLNDFVKDFAEGLQLADAQNPQAKSKRDSSRIYKPGIGPHGENETVSLVLDELTNKPWSAEQSIPYPSSRQKCDLLVSRDQTSLYIEVKMLRLMGDNGKPNDNMLSHILSPYPINRSAVTDCEKLANSKFDGEKAILIIAYDYPDFPSLPAIEVFESVAINWITPRKLTAAFGNLIHPVHQSGVIYAWLLKNV